MLFRSTILGVTYKNSELPEDVLLTVFGVKLFKAAAESLLRIEKAALQEGLDFFITSGYREGGQPGDGLKYLKKEINFTQWAAWELWNNGISGSILDPNTNKTYNVGPPKWNLASNPTLGFKSNHGFGIAVDIYGKNPESKNIVA